MYTASVNLVTFLDVCSHFVDYISSPWGASGRFLTEFSFAALFSTSSVERLKASVVKPSSDAIQQLHKDVTSLYAAALENKDPVWCAFKVFSNKADSIKKEHEKEVKKVLKTEFWWPVTLSLITMGAGIYQYLGPFSILLLFPLYKMRKQLKKIGNEALEKVKAVKKDCDDVLKEQSTKLDKEVNTYLDKVQGEQKHTH